MERLKLSYSFWVKGWPSNRLCRINPQYQFALFITIRIKIISLSEKKYQFEYLQVEEAYPNSELVIHALFFGSFSKKNYFPDCADLSGIFHNPQHLIQWVCQHYQLYPCCKTSWRLPRCCLSLSAVSALLTTASFSKCFVSLDFYISWFLYGLNSSYAYLVSS